MKSDGENRKVGKTKVCFVCNRLLEESSFKMNPVVMKPICPNCSGTSQEKQKEEDLLDSLADGLICGCI
ncbi:MAG TPA: hypothetical protein DCY25_03830 [Bacteroidales bacterium]|nr:hypothetical protein [Bacteroidales bacterium]